MTTAVTELRWVNQCSTFRKKLFKLWIAFGFLFPFVYKIF